MGGASTTKDYLVKGAASKKRKTYRTPDFITGRFDDRATTNIAILSVIPRLCPWNLFCHFERSREISIILADSEKSTTFALGFVEGEFA